LIVTFAATVLEVVEPFFGVTIDTDAPGAETVALVEVLDVELELLLPHAATASDAHATSANVGSVLLAFTRILSLVVGVATARYAVERVVDHARPANAATGRETTAGPHASEAPFGWPWPIRSANRP
jgi:hypothetical protein